MSKKITPAKAAAAKRAAFANQRHLMATSEKRHYGLPKNELRHLRMKMGCVCQPLGPKRTESQLCGMYWTSYPYVYPHDWYHLYYLTQMR